MKTLLIEELEEVKWTNEEGWERVRTTLRLVRCFSFVGEATKAAVGSSSSSDIHEKVKKMLFA